MDGWLNRWVAEWVVDSETLTFNPTLATWAISTLGGGRQPNEPYSTFLPNLFVTDVSAERVGAGAGGRHAEGLLRQPGHLALHLAGSEGGQPAAGQPSVLHNPHHGDPSDTGASYEQIQA